MSALAVLCCGQRRLWCEPSPVQPLPVRMGSDARSYRLYGVQAAFWFE